MQLFLLDDERCLAPSLHDRHDRPAGARLGRRHALGEHDLPILPWVLEPNRYHRAREWLHVELRRLAVLGRSGRSELLRRDRRKCDGGEHDGEPAAQRDHLSLALSSSARARASP